MDDFEQHLAKQTLKAVPDEWRAEILSNARDADTEGFESSRKMKRSGWGLLSLIRGWFWPHPGAWAGLAAIWLLLFAMQHQMNVEIQEELALAGIKPPITDVMVAMEQHQFVIDQLLAMNNFEPPIIDRPRRTPGSPTNLPPLMILTT